MALVVEQRRGDTFPRASDPRWRWTHRSLRAGHHPSRTFGVLAGRLPVWGLAADGENGARAVLELLREELAVALHLTGCRAVTELGREHVTRATRQD